MLEVLTNGWGEDATNGCIGNADRGYGKTAFMDLLSEFCFGSVFVMQENLLRVHPFVGKSFLNPSRADVEDEENEREGSLGEGEQVSDVSLAVNADRKRAFIVDDNPQFGPEVFMASKSVGASSSSKVGQKRVTSIAVKESGREKFGEVLRFMYAVPTSIEEHLNNWVAVPKDNCTSDNVLFTRRSEKAHVEALQLLAERTLTASCTVLTVGQRCADWLALRKFRITGTNAGVILMSNPNVRSVLGLESQMRPEKTIREWLQFLCYGWFSSKLSTEAMMRESSNENAVLSPLRALPFVCEVFETGLFSKRIQNS